MTTSDIIEVTIAAGRRRGPLRSIACLMQEAIKSFNATLIDIEHFWANQSPVLRLKVLAGAEAGALSGNALKDQLYAAAERALDKALFAQPWETIPLIVDSRGERCGNGLVVYAHLLPRAAEKLLASPAGDEPRDIAALTRLILHCMAQPVDLKQLAFAIALEVFATRPADQSALTTQMHAVFSEHEFEQLTRRPAAELAQSPVAEAKAFTAFSANVSSADSFVLEVFSRLGFSPRECVYIAYIGAQLASAHSNVAQHSAAALREAA